MTSSTKKTAPPRALKDRDLDQSSGGIIAVLIGAKAEPRAAPKAGGSNFLLGDGSVRF